MNTNRRIGIVLCSTLAALVGLVRAETTAASLKAHEISPGQELLVTDLAVVDSRQAKYPGPWSFGHLMEQAFGKEAAPKIVKDWLLHWQEGTAMGNNQKLAASRPDIRERLVAPWQKADGYTRSKDEWIPNFENAPFRLLAIVNRMDLALPLEGFQEAVSLPSPPRSAYRAAANLALDSSAGEARLVFAVTDQEGNCLVPGTTVIFEYGLDVIGQRRHLFEWGEAWHDLGGRETINAEYLEDLEAVTRAFTDRRSVAPGSTADAEAAKIAAAIKASRTANPPLDPEVLKDLLDRSRALARDRARDRTRRVDPVVQRLATRSSLPLVKRLSVGNGSVASQLMRIRINDGSFGQIREFREFHVLAQELQPAVLAGTPPETHFTPRSEANEDFAKWLQTTWTSQPKIRQLRDLPGGGVPGNFDVPLEHLSLVSTVPTGDASYHWDGPGVERRLRHGFSRQTCCGCHCGDTGTEFFHIAPRARGEVTKLSPFLQISASTQWVKDPAGLLDFPLNEMRTRLAAFEKLLTAPIEDLTTFAPARSVNRSGQSR